jgi:hypothetical protein
MVVLLMLTNRELILVYHARRYIFDLTDDFYFYIKKLNKLIGGKHEENSFCIGNYTFVCSFI